MKFARNPRIHTFIATSPIHMEYKLRKTPDEVVELAVAAVKRAASYTPNVEFSAEDASRTDRDFLVRIVTAAIDAGATTINIPDTVGFAQPDEFGALIRYVIDNVPNSDKAIFSVHCHDDLGLAVANSLAAVKNGARQAELCLSGIGERAGNASLEGIRHGAQAPSRILRRGNAPSSPNSFIRPAICFRSSSAVPFRPTRPSSAATPLPMNPASIRTACSRTATPTKS